MDAGLRVLGRPSLEIDGRVVEITPKPLLLVVRLALAAPSTVSVDIIRSSLWPDDSSESAVRVNVTRARRILGTERIVANGHAYRLVDVQTDSDDFERLVAAGRSGRESLERRIAAYDEALALWRGPAFDGVGDLPWLSGPARALDDLREQAIDERAALLIETGAHERAIPTLSLGAEQHPLREERSRLLALALYRSGRQVEALGAITRTRRELRDQLGLHPGPALDEMERRLLAHDPTLQPASDGDRFTESLEITARINAAAALIQAEVFEEARSILATAEQRAAVIADRSAAASVLLAQAELAMRTGETDPHPLIDLAQQTARELGDGRLLARAALVRVGAGVPDDRPAVLVELTEPIALLDESAPEQIELLCMAAVFVMLIDAPEAGEQLLEEAERRYATLGDERSEVLVLVARSIVHSTTADRLARSVTDAGRALDIARSVGDARLIVTAMQPALRAAYAGGQLSAVDAMLGELDRLSRRAALPYGRVRAELCRATNALARADIEGATAHHARARRLADELRTFAAGRAMSSQALLLAWEQDQLEPLLGIVTAQAEVRGPSVWHAVAAICGDEQHAASLADIEPKVPRDASYLPFTAIAAETAARRGDAVLADRVIGPLDAVGDHAVLVGLGTVVLGFGAHFAGLACVARSDLGGAEQRLTRAVDLAGGAGAPLWEAHSLVELAAVLAARREPPAQDRAARILDDLRNGPVAAVSARLARRITEVGGRRAGTQ